MIEIKWVLPMGAAMRGSGGARCLSDYGFQKIDVRPTGSKSQQKLTTGQPGANTGQIKGLCI